MSFLFIGSTGDQAGHSLVTWAIARRLLDGGLRVGLVKPFGTDPVNVEGAWVDRDASLFKEVLKLHDPLDRICPYPDFDEGWRQKGAGEILEEFSVLAQELAKEKDVLIIMGSKHIFVDDASYPVSDVSFITALKADVILVNRYRSTSRSIYSILSLSSLLKGRIKGIILNRVPPERVEELRNHLIPALIQKGVPTPTVMPEDPVLSFQTIREIQEILDGKVLWGDEGLLGRLVGGMTVGSAELKGELLIFKRVYNKIILLEPFGPDAEIENSEDRRSIAGIILTGGRNPVPQVLDLARKAGVPLILIKDDTFAALERLEKIPSRLSPADETKVGHFSRLMEANGVFDDLFNSLALMR